MGSHIPVIAKIVDKAKKFTIKTNITKHVHYGKITIDNFNIKDEIIIEIECNNILFINMELCLAMTYLTMYNNLINLTRLYISNVVVDRMFIMSLNDLPKLRDLSIVFCNLEDHHMEYLDVKTSLSKLTVSSNKTIIYRKSRKYEITLNRLDFVRVLPNLKYLDVSESNISNDSMYHLESLNHLTGLVLSDTRVSDNIVTTIVKLTTLRELDITDTLVSEQSYNYIKENCKIKKLYHHSDSSSDDFEMI